MLKYNMQRENCTWQKINLSQVNIHVTAIQRNKTFLVFQKQKAFMHCKNRSWRLIEFLKLASYTVSL